MQPEAIEHNEILLSPLCALPEDYKTKLKYRMITLQRNVND
jgi:hypothetical protein